MPLNETKIDLLKDLSLNENDHLPNLESMSEGETKYLRDLRINLKNTLSSENLNLKEAYLIALAIAANEGNKILTGAFTSLAKLNNASGSEIAEAIACASMLASNNVFYRFKHFIKGSNENYQSMPAGIKMNVMMNPILGKELFELTSLAVSAVNGCESCVNSHEESVRKLGASEARIFDAIRLASVVRGLCVAVN
ncbi:MAG: carboxymuconolactone decarboxylase family protein [Ignavibacteriaceae bacterium]|nr:carboxymuconolactone decarboxylase family protein [Ignavibacteriaceae bacterium]